LPVDGTYHVLVRAPDAQASQTGHYVLAVWNAQVQVAPLVLNQQVTGVIPTAYRVDRWTFSAPANTQVQFRLVNASSPAIKFTLNGPGGWTGFSGLAGSS